jgi:hypothetical protein
MKKTVVSVTSNNLNDVLKTLSEAFGVEIGILPPPDFGHDVLATAHDFDYYHECVANKVGIKSSNLRNIFVKIAPHYIEGVKQFYYWEIALDMDNHYKDHILNSKELWMINPLRHTPYKIGDRENIKQMYKFIPLFRSKEECQKAIEIVCGE